MANDSVSVTIERKFKIGRETITFWMGESQSVFADDGREKRSDLRKEIAEQINEDIVSAVETIQEEEEE